MDKEAISAASEIIHSDDFYGRQYGAMFEAITELYNEGKPTDLVAVQEQLKTKDVPPESYSIAAFRELLNMVPTSVNIRYYANLVYEKALLRRLIRINEEIANDCYMEKEDVNTILESTEKRIFGLLETRATSDYVPIRDVVINVVNKIEIASRNHSMVLLREGQLSVAEIAAKIGYINPNKFTSAFCSEYKMTPTEYKKDVQMDRK